MDWTDLAILYLHGASRNFLGTSAEPLDIQKIALFLRFESQVPLRAYFLPLDDVKYALLSPDHSL